MIYYRFRLIWSSIKVIKLVGHANFVFQITILNRCNREIPNEISSYYLIYIYFSHSYKWDIQKMSI